jgi:general secretion pathway protein E/type IV pilus assembly protein PilB
MEKLSENNNKEKAEQIAVRIGDLLLKKNLISADQLSIALEEQKNKNLKLGEMLLDLGFISQSALNEVLSEISGYNLFNPKSSEVKADVLNLIPKDFALKYQVFPIELENKVLKLAMSDMFDVVAVDAVGRLIPDVQIEPQVSSQTDIMEAIDKYYGHELSIDSIIKELENEDSGSLENYSNLKDYEHPIVRLISSVLSDAVKLGVSDIHFEPEGNFLRIRYRVDGILMLIRTLHKKHWSAMSHRIKIIASMNIADKLNPQDGRVSIKVDNRAIDLRVSSMPTIHGENIVIRVLDKQKMSLGMEDLGFSENVTLSLEKILKRPQGILLVTGPTGAGKTTTLYAIISQLNSLDVNIMTLEDPVEYEVPLIRQSSARENTQVSFAEGIRSMLRQDPDIMLVGEIRDDDTAAMALRASMTGHKVFSTLHTNDALGAIPRLIDLGIKPSLMAGNIMGIIAQRLVRKLCPYCRQEKKADEKTCKLLGLDSKNPPKIAYPKGCPHCNNLGYKGRIAVSEILPMMPEIEDLIIKDAPLSEVAITAKKYGFMPMTEDGRNKVLEKVISVESLMKVVDISSLEK